MNARIFPVVSVATLLLVSTGCSGMQSFLFGRGARCGLCNRVSTAGQALNPFAPAPGSRPVYGSAPQAPGQQGVSPYAPPYASPQPGGFTGAPTCGDCVGSGADCSCGSVNLGYGGGGDPYSGVIYGDEVIMSDDFNPRASDGVRIDGESVPPPQLPSEPQ